MSNLVILIPFVIIALVIGLVIVLLIYSHKREKERTRQLQVTAGQLGWMFAENAPLNMIPAFERFALFNLGHGRNIKNMMYGEANGIKAAVFDYIYVTGSGKHRQTHYQSVVYLEPANLFIPYFSLRPEGFLLKIFQAFGYQDIDFGQRPNFSSQYILRGQDELAIRQAFNDGLLSFYETYPGTCTDGGGNQLFVYRSGQRFEPHEIQQYVGFGLQIMNLFPRY